MRKLEQLNTKKVSLEEIQRLYRLDAYSMLHQKVKELVEAGYLQPIKGSKLNGKSPALYNRYKYIQTQEDVAAYEEELLYQMSTMMDVAYYLGNMERYKEDRQYVRALSAYLKRTKGYDEPVSMNERSFEIWGREKYLKKEGGTTLLKRVGVTLDSLHIYETIMPVAYYTQHKKTPQNVLIVENMDTFYSMRRHLMQGKYCIHGIEIGTLIFGGGKQIVKSFEPFLSLGEAYLKDEGNRFLYFGDLDYEGIGIYESLVEQTRGDRHMTLFYGLYEKMLEKNRERAIPLPKMKDKQHQVEGVIFYKGFSEVHIDEMKTMLAKGYYIPQEILNMKDF